ncbi:hypothetical protein B0H13DRAFT_2657922, partial [Mycena leptocephala]
MSLEASVFATRYVSAIGVAALLYDHVLTLDDEIQCIWLNPATGVGNRLSFLVNRYLTECVVLAVAYAFSGNSEGLTTRVRYSVLLPTYSDFCQIFIWMFAICSTIFVAVSHFIIIARVYTLWDRRPVIKWILSGSFGVAITVSMAFCILAAHQVQPFLTYNEFIHMCTFSQKPRALPFMLGTLTVFDLFIIVMTIINAFHKPYQNQAEVMTSLQRDGARMFVIKGVSSTVIVAAVDVTLLLRVWILFGKSRRLLYFLIHLMSVEIGVMFFVSIFTIHNSDEYVHL